VGYATDALTATPPLLRLFGAALLRVWPLLAAGCASTTLPCASASSCPKTFECLASRCVPEGGAPVRANTHRLELTPSEFEVTGGEPRDGLPAVAVLGSKQVPNAELYLRFAPAWRGREVESAFLILQPQLGAARGADVSLEVWRVNRAWTGSSFARDGQPGHVALLARGIARSSPPTTTRIDVTELVRFLATHPEEDFGFAVRSPNTSAAGVAFATGADGGRAPRLDLYLGK